MNDVAVRHEEFGTGPHAVIALHGWFGSAGAWGGLIPHLDGDAFRYVFPNYRGYGARRGVAGDFTVAEAASDVLDLADSLGINDFTLIGHSMGGSVMQYVLAEAPDRVRGLIGISPVPAGGIELDEQGWALFSGAAAEPANRKAIIDLTTGGRRDDEWLDRLVAHSLEHSDASAFGAYLDSWVRDDFHERIEGSTKPIKVIVGEHDPALGEDLMNATFKHWYPNLELDVLPDAGHYAMEESPLQLARLVENFLRRT